MVTCDALGGRRAYLKPMKKERGPFQCRAGREKIVADLAHDLGISVPPVLLFRREDAPAEEETLCCVSLVMFPTQYSWGEIKRFIIDPTLDKGVNQTLMSKLPVAAAQAMVLDTWVLQPDHNDHPHNMLFGFDPKAMNEGRFVFLDFALALGHRWVEHPALKALGWESWDRPGAAEKRLKTPFPPHMDRFLQREALEDTLLRVEQLTDHQIEEIVGRIPDDFIGKEERSIIATGLKTRRGLIRSCPSISKHLA